MDNMTYTDSEGKQGIFYISDKHFVNDSISLPGGTLNEKKRQRIRTNAFKKKIEELFGTKVLTSENK